MTDLFNRESGVITVYADLACPFASLVIAGLRAARSRSGRSELRLDLRAFPLELINSRPHSFSALEAEKVVLGGLDPTLGWRRWRGSRSNWPATTLLPMEAVQAAKRIGGLRASEELDSALRRAFYVDSRCIALLPVILEVAESVAGLSGLSSLLRSGAGGRAEVFEQLAQHERSAVRGSPHVFTADGRDWVNPGMVLEHAGDYPVIKAHDPGTYEEIVNAA